MALFCHYVRERFVQHSEPAHESPVIRQGSHECRSTQFLRIIFQPPQLRNFVTGLLEKLVLNLLRVW